MNGRLSESSFLTPYNGLQHLLFSPETPNRGDHAAGVQDFVQWRHQGPSQRGTCRRSSTLIFTPVTVVVRATVGWGRSRAGGGTACVGCILQQWKFMFTILFPFSCSPSFLLPPSPPSGSGTTIGPSGFEQEAALWRKCLPLLSISLTPPSRAPCP